MTRHFALRWLLAISVIAGLALAPLSRPAMAQAHSDMSMPAMADEMSMAADEMSDMDCCPPKAQAPVDCDKCIFMAACMSKSFAGAPITEFRLYFTASATIALDRNDFQPDELGRPPPEHPPRILV